MIFGLEKILGIFRKKKAKQNEDNFQNNYQELKFTGEEPLCMACQYPIHETERSRRLDGKRIHCKCFKQISKMIRDGKQ